MTNPKEIVPGIIFYSYLSATRKEKVGFWGHCTLVMLVAGQFKLEMAGQEVSMRKGQMLLIRKNQLGQITKTPLPGEEYQSIVIVLQEDLLRTIALEEQIEAGEKYVGSPIIRIPPTEFLQGFFQSVMPYIHHPEEKLTSSLGLLKVKEAVQLVLHAMPSLKNFLFDFSEPHKIDLENFMLANFHYNIPIQRFAQLTGRSLAAFKRDFQKIFGMAPRQWLQQRRLTEARHLIEKKNKKPSAIYLDLGFESLSHFSHAFKKQFGKAPTG